MTGGSVAPMLVFFLLAAGLVSGCLNASVVDPADADEPEKRFNRINSLSGGSSISSSCPFLSSTSGFGRCLEGDLEFTDFLCDPPQWALRSWMPEPVPMEEFFPAAFEGSLPTPEGDSRGAYVYCEHRLVWEVSAQALPEDSQLHVTIRIGDDMRKAACTIPFNGGCTVKDQAELAFFIQAPGDSIEMEAQLEAVIEYPEPLLGDGGSFDKQIHWRLGT